ncbi:hypothetical protein [Burkholderia sp. S-53]|uniref:hypothetical protein n=1 Tax=Burkholderia sp. S-53 TaxID=2906514 RepID=UPI0021CEE259|nr:hypothetical protein [Burkholderia sp. S-53]UXU85745.1 hypothetical protein LXM88_00130 [Burkholderia sp. S-53]
MKSLPSSDAGRFARRDRTAIDRPCIERTTLARPEARDGIAHPGIAASINRFLNRTNADAEIKLRGVGKTKSFAKVWAKIDRQA